MASAWDAFPNAPEGGGGGWARFPNAEPTPAPAAPARVRPKPAAIPRPVQSPFEVAARAIDGDTIRLQDGTLRLWGIDAPELAQQGWNRGGEAQPVGEQSREHLLNLIAGRQITQGPSQGRSFGRVVAPLTASQGLLGRFDVGEQMVRSGSALAAPSFVSGDPDYRFDLLQSERLARLNQLGPLHDNYVRPPDEHRADPSYIVPRETVAQFWDTPTPNAGMRAEVEQEFYRLLNDHSVPASEVAAYARSNGGFVVDPREVEANRKQAKRDGQKIGIGYAPAPQVLTDAGDGAAGAAVRSFGQGFVAGGLDELGAVVDTVGLTPGRMNIWNSDERLADIWANNRAQNASILGYDEFAHPVASTVANVGGAVTSGFALPWGAGARTVPQLARVGAAYGATEGVLGTEGGIIDRTKGAAIGAPLGAAINAIGGKALELGVPMAQAWRRARSNRAAPTSERAPSQDDWAQFPDADAPPESMAMEAPPLPALSEPMRERDYLNVAPGMRPGRLDDPLSEAQLRAAAQRIDPGDVLPSRVASSGDAGLLSPAGGDAAPDAAHYAGNIRLDKLDTPQDIERALKQPSDRIGFDAAMRGRVSHAETERLASELNMTPEQLLGRRQGQAFNAEEALAARQILAKSGNELVNAAKRIRSLDDPGDEMLAEFRRKWLRHVAIQEQVAGATAEAGRALQQFRMAANSREVRGDVLNAFVRGGGGKDNLQDAAQTLLDAMEAGPGVFNTVAKKAAQPKWRDKITEFYINAILSGPQTHAVNITSNTLTAMAQIPEFATAAVLGGLRQATSRAPVDRIVATEVGQRAFGLLQGAREGARLFARALRTGEASDFASKVEGQQYKAIEGLKGEVVRIPTRLLTAEDELFKGVARRMELIGLAARQAHREGLKGEAAQARIAELVADPTDEMFERALDYGRYLTFQRSLGPLAQKVSGVTQDSLIAKIFLPFVRTPTNLIKFAAERSPAAPLLKEWRRDFMAGGARRDLAVAKALLGTGLGMAMYEGALRGHITGSAPSDQKRSRLLYADGWQPYSIRIGDRWYSYKRLDPFSTTIGVAADLATMPEGLSEKQRENKATLLVASIMGNLASKTWLSGLSDLTEALNDPGRYAGNLEQRLVASFLVPNFATQIARTIDPVRRERDGVGEELRSRVPGLSQGLLPQRNIWGEEIRSGDNVGPDILSPLWVSEALNDPVNAALLPLDYAPGYPSKKVRGRELSPEEYDRYSEMAGKLAHGRLEALVTGPEWEVLGYEEKKKAAKKIVDQARDDARTSLFGGNSDEWSSFPDAKGPARVTAPGDDDPWEDFEDVPVGGGRG